MFNYYINERNAYKDERELANLKVEQEVICNRFNVITFEQSVVKNWLPVIKTRYSSSLTR